MEFTIFTSAVASPCNNSTRIEPSAEHIRKKYSPEPVESLNWLFASIQRRFQSEMFRNSHSFQLETTHFVTDLRHSSSAIDSNSLHLTTLFVNFVALCASRSEHCATEMHCPWRAKHVAVKKQVKTPVTLFSAGYRQHRE